ncbi:Spiroplasmavirus-related protein [Spiroplasma kunkelii CR2-3x]|uniref:Spiroplasmavirus-related protein n=1 Tax=Spiroplasma kunkelii CR2-3x TaxID=273035 RepID=A0A0K2JG60_SPIKU|nr:Spiroplasmavirus-related protein [Spiroplasma kunkelii CR2-3x]
MLISMIVNGKKFVRDLKNDEIIDKKEYYWSEITKLSVKERLELFDIDIFKKNLKLIL